MTISFSIQVVCVCHFASCVRGEEALFLVFKMLLFAAFLLAFAGSCSAAAPEPYPYLSDGAFIGPTVSASPDPLVQYRWNAGVNETQLQIYIIRAVSVTAFPPSSFLNLESLLTGLII